MFVKFITVFVISSHASATHWAAHHNARTRSQSRQSQSRAISSKAVSNGATQTEPIISTSQQTQTEPPTKSNITETIIKMIDDLAIQYPEVPLTEIRRQINHLLISQIELELSQSPSVINNINDRNEHFQGRITPGFIRYDDDGHSIVSNQMNQIQQSQIPNYFDCPYERRMSRSPQIAQKEILKFDPGTVERMVFNEKGENIFCLDYEVDSDIFGHALKIIDTRGDRGYNATQFEREYPVINHSIIGLLLRVKMIRDEPRLELIVFMDDSQQGLAIIIILSDEDRNEWIRKTKGGHSEGDVVDSGDEEIAAAFGSASRQIWVEDFRRRLINTYVMDSSNKSPLRVYCSPSSDIGSSNGDKKKRQSLKAFFGRFRGISLFASVSPSSGETGDSPIFSQNEI